MSTDLAQATDSLYKCERCGVTSDCKQYGLENSEWLCDPCVEQMSTGRKHHPPAETPSLLKQFVQLQKRRRELEFELENNKALIAKIEEPLLDQWADMGMQNANVDGLCVYVRIDKYVSKKSDVETAAVNAALREVGLGYMVAESYNSSSLKAKIGEYQKENVEIPEQLVSVLNIGEIARLATRLS